MSAVVEAVECVDDGRWTTIRTRKRIVHVYPVNPYGGKPSHLEGWVRNVDEVVSMIDLFFLFYSCALIDYLTAAHAHCPWKSARLLGFVSRDSWFQPRSLSLLRSSKLPNHLNQPSHRTQANTV